MSDLFERMARLTRELGIVVTASAGGDEAKSNVAATLIELPDRVFDQVTRQMAFLQKEWPADTSFAPLTGQLRISGIRIERAGKTPRAISP